VWWSANASFAAEPSLETQETWESIMPQGRGFIQHPKLAKDGEVKAIAVFHEIHCLVWFRTTSVHDPLLIESNSTVFEQLSTRMHTSSPNSNISNLKQDRFLTPALPIASSNHPPKITSDTAMTIRPLQCSSRTRS
jgi:hypothetical protein